MLNSLPLFVGLRYVRARSHKFFVSFITWVSLLCVCLGVMALIVILSVMNGLEGELRDRLLSLSAHARIFVPPQASGTPDWNALAASVRQAPNVTGAAPFIELEALAVRKPDMLPVRLRGIDPSHEGEVARMAKSIVEGRLADLTAGLGSRDRRAQHCADARARPRRSDHGADSDHRRERRAGTAPARIHVAGVFDAAVQDYDGELLIADARRCARAAAESGCAHVAAREFQRCADRQRELGGAREDAAGGRRDPRLDAWITPVTSAPSASRRPWWR